MVLAEFQVEELRNSGQEKGGSSSSGFLLTVSSQGTALASLSYIFDEMGVRALAPWKAMMCREPFAQVVNRPNLPTASQKSALWAGMLMGAQDL